MRINQEHKQKLVKGITALYGEGRKLYKATKKLKKGRGMSMEQYNTGLRKFRNDLVTPQVGAYHFNFKAFKPLVRTYKKGMKKK